ncbi:MAG: histidinol-phosphate transaminase [Gemmatimonadaceae bacterium]
MITVDCDTEGLARAAVSALPLYAPDVTPCAVDVSDNINLWGTPPAALRALSGAPSTHPSRYPSLYSTPLRDAVLRYVGLSGVSGVGVVTGCGSDDVLDATMRAFGNARDEIVFAAPTFAMIPIFGRLNGMVPVSLAMTEGFDADPQQLVDRRARITYLCTPNNPTSTALSRETVEYVAANAAGLVIIDEAYAEFSPHTFIELASTHERVLVTRTFSKAFGLAGLRVGYGVGSEAVVNVVARARGPFKVNALAEAAALAALGEGPDALGWVARHAALAVRHRERLAAELRARGLEPMPSAANFLFIPTPRAPALARALRDRGVLVRALSGLPRDLAVLEASEGHALRIGVGPWDVMETVLRSLDEALACA